MRPGLLAFLLAAFGCSDPVHDRVVDGLGPEAPDVPRGPLHRPGQPCGACHGELGPARSAFSLSGTVYRASVGDEPERGLAVRVIDSRGLQHTLKTNEVGSFFATSDEYAPVFPVWIKLERGEQVVEMRSASSREASCAACHDRVAAAAKVGQVYFEMPSAQSGGAGP